jgi:ketosteroid isomerase-like protein
VDGLDVKLCSPFNLSDSSYITFITLSDRFWIKLLIRLSAIIANCAISCALRYLGVTLFITHFLKPKSMKINNLKGLLLCAILILPFTGKLFGQTWSPQQKEVWSNVETYWSMDAKGDLDGFLSYFSDEYKGWSYNSIVPASKETTAKYMRHDHANSKKLFFDITPLSIHIHGDIAIVNYLYNLQTEDMEKKKKWSSGRWTDILKKTGAKWLLIADHGGEVKDK